MEVGLILLRLIIGIVILIPTIFVILYIVNKKKKRVSGITLRASEDIIKLRYRRSGVSRTNHPYAEAEYKSPTPIFLEPAPIPAENNFQTTLSQKTNYTNTAQNSITSENTIQTRFKVVNFTQPDIDTRPKRFTQTYTPGNNANPSSFRNNATK